MHTVKVLILGFFVCMLAGGVLLVALAVAYDVWERHDAARKDRRARADAARAEAEDYALFSAEYVDDGIRALENLLRHRGS